MTWQRVAALEDVPAGTAVQVELAGEPICVVRLAGGEARAVHDTCSHQEYPLHEGWVESDNGSGRIECALHGSMFDLDTGTPESLPATQPIPTYACAVRDGAIWVDVEQQTNDAPLPRH